LIAPVRRCGDWSRTNKVARSSRCIAQSLRSGVSPAALVVQEGPPRRPVETTRVLIAVWRACADCFRSQLRRLGFGQPPQARPQGGCANITRGFPSDPQNRNFLLCWKPELSTLLRHPSHTDLADYLRSPGYSISVTRRRLPGTASRAGAGRGRPGRSTRHEYLFQ
jgi:hypothetical protein